MTVDEDYAQRFGGLARLYGAGVFVTGAFGFVAAGEIVRRVAG